MSEENGEKKRRLTWQKVFPAPIRQRYMILSGTEIVIDGLKTFCDAGRPDIAYNIMEVILGRQIPILLSHPDFLPNICAVFEADKIVEYEEHGFFIAFSGYSARSGEIEFSCMFFDDELLYARVCTVNEVYKVWQRLNKDLENVVQ